MAKITLSGLIQSISGKMGNLVFVRGKRNIYIRLKIKAKNPKSKRQREVRRIFGEITKKWKECDIIQQVLWEDFAKNRQYTKIAIPKIIKSTNNGWVDGFHAFKSINQLLIISGFEIIHKPPVNALLPPTPACDLKQYGTYTAPLKFNIWGSSHYEKKLKAHIWVKKTGEWNTPHIAKIVEISEIPQQVTIEKIKVRRVKNKTTQMKLKNITPCKLKIQMRIIAENGRPSIPSPIYTLQIIV